MAKISMMQRKTILNTTWAVQIVFVFVQLCVLALHPNDLQAQSNLTEIVIPVSGKFAFTEGPTDSVLVLDTMTGTVDTLGVNIGQPLIWNPNGEKLAFNQYGADLAYYDYASSSLIQVETSDPETLDIVFHPVGWSADSKNFMYLRIILGSGVMSMTYDFYLFDWNTHTSTSIGNYQTNIPLTGIRVTSGLEDLSLSNISQSKRNPIRDEWTFIQFELSDSNEDEGTTQLHYINILWNTITGQMISVDELFPDPITPSPVTWSDDGKYLLIKTGGNSFKQHIVRFNTDNTLVDKDSAIIEAEDTTISFLGASNLILSYDGNAVTSSDDQLVYNIAEIVDGNWVETEFFRLNGAYQAGDWHITASDEEKKTLSCIFDQTLPPQLQPDQRGQVAFTGGIPSRLRTDPGIDSEVIVQMPEGTAFDVLTTPECRDGYRWWQIQLDDGTTGYAAESNTTEYFLEPVTP